MKRAIITVQTIQDAQARGGIELAVPYSAVVTPSARDAASASGIRLVRETCPEKEGRAPCRENRTASAGNAAPAAAAVQANPAPGEENADALFAAIKKRVTDRLPPALRDIPALDAAIRTSLVNVMGRKAVPVAAAGPDPQPARKGKTDAVPLLARCAAVCRKQPRRIVFPDAADARVLTAAARLKREGLAEPVLLGTPDSLREAAAQAGVSLSALHRVDHETAETLEANARDYLRIAEQSGKPVTVEAAVAFARSPLAAGALMVRRGEADLGIAGNLSPTADVLRAGLRVIGPQPGTRTVFGLFFLLSPGGDVSVFADCAVIPEPSAEQLADIAIGSAAAYTNLTGDAARVALLSFATKGSAEHPRIALVREGLALARTRAPSLILDGEMQFDAAVSPVVADQKAPGSPLGGKANVFVFPSLEAGNIGYKIAQRFGGYMALGPFLAGFAKGWHDLSRGCDAEDVYTIAVVGAGLMSQDKAR